MDSKPFVKEEFNSNVSIKQENSFISSKSINGKTLNLKNFPKKQLVVKKIKPIVKKFKNESVRLCKKEFIRLPKLWHKKLSK